MISKLTIFIGLFIIISASFMRQLVDFARVHIGEKNVTLLIVLILIISGVAFLMFIIKKSLNFVNLSLIFLLTVIGLALTWRLKIPVEKIHILEYGLLGWLAGRDLIKTGKKINGSIFACIFSIIVGVLDEAFQAVLPYRYFEIKDIVLNGLGGLWGLSLYLLS